MQRNWYPGVEKKPKYISWSLSILGLGHFLMSTFMGNRCGASRRIMKQSYQTFMCESFPRSPKLLHGQKIRRIKFIIYIIITKLYYVTLCNVHYYN